VFAAIYAFLGCQLMAAHIKAVFFLPAIAFSAFVVIRRPLPFALSLAVTGFGVMETYRFWQTRAYCPESEFLTSIFRALSLSPADIVAGPSRLVTRAHSNFRALGTYWQNTKFSTDYQAAWLPGSSQPVTAVETAVNLAIPVVVALAICLVLFVAAARIADRERAPPSPATIVACCLILALAGLAAFQGVKNFYEVALHAPILVLAVILSIPDGQGIHATRRASYILAFLLIGLATASQFAFVSRFSSTAREWRKEAGQLAHRQQKLGDLVARCGTATGPQASRIAMDDFTYTLLWRTREPIIMPYFNGFWATGMNQQKVLRDRKISALVSACYMLPLQYRSSAITNDEGYCCARMDTPP
jgi:hypothetical protein